MHPRVSVSQICFMSEPVARVGALCREIGAQRVGLLNDALLEEMPSVQAMLADGALKPAAVTHVFMAGKRYPADAQTVEAERAKLSRVIQLVKSIGAPPIYMVAGGRGPGSWDASARAFRDALAPCILEAREAGVVLSVEPAPIVYANIHIAHSLRDTMKLADIAGIDVCIDLGACWTEADLRELITEVAPRCTLVQVSDFVFGDRSFPCRAVPGDGVVPLKQIFDWLLSAGYKGAFDLELLGPRIEEEGRAKAVTRAAKHVSAILTELGA
jgi:sugar phosphate isomerase/epimerase